MATAKVVSTERQIIETDVTGYDLSLSVEEAEVLQFILERIGGDPRTTKRGIASDIGNALYNAGVKERRDFLVLTSHRAIYFANDTDKDVESLDVYRR